jgi:hypothetical protein
VGYFKPLLSAYFIFTSSSLTTFGININLIFGKSPIFTIHLTYSKNLSLGMKKIMYLMTFLAIGFNVNGQSDAVSISADTLVFSGFNMLNDDDFADLYTPFYFKNISADDDSFIWVRTYNQLPSEEWSSAVCDINLCHGTEVDSATFKLSVGDSGVFYSHFYPGKGKGTAYMTIQISNIKNRSQSASIHSIVTAWDAYAHSPETTRMDFRMFPNPNSSGTLFITPFTGSIRIIDIHGRCIFSQAATSDLQAIDISGLQAGHYHVIVEQQNTLYTRKLILH